MHKLYHLIFVVIASICILYALPADAISGNVVISQVKVGNSTTSRLIELYNNSTNPVDVTGWCIYYSSPNNTAPYTKVTCFNVTDPSEHVFINARSYILAASSQTGIQADMIIDVGLGSGTSGHVYLFDNNGLEVDRVGWGTAINAESNKPVIVDSTKVIERKIDVSSGIYIDSDDNEADFFNSSLRVAYQYGALFEVTDMCNNLSGLQDNIPDGYEQYIDGTCAPPIVDICTNLEGLQIEIPSGYMLDENSDCQADVCLNLGGLQLVVPEGMELDNAGACVSQDVCLNLTGRQGTVPDGFTESAGNCTLNLLPLNLSELLPNPIGSDDGNEYIEIFNPNSSSVDLMYYVFYVGSNTEDFYSFPTGLIIGPGEYMAFYSDDIKFTLVNTTSSVNLRSLDNIMIDEVPIYSDPKDGTAWALLDGIWQFTNHPTPGQINQTSDIESVVENQTNSSLKPCKPGQYRNPETNRCKSISSESSLVPCRVGQYRSEETGRCRNIASDVSNLIPCAEGQERNPLTNRCRSVKAVLAATTLAPCKEGQERNPETNRCRNITGDMPIANYAVEQTNFHSDNSVVWWSVVGVGALAIVYGVWEWRQEIIIIVKKVANVLNRSK